VLITAVQDRERRPAMLIHGARLRGPERSLDVALAERSPGARGEHVADE
jgi:hypothetical protein